jgi:murein L,D-transpeptidase YcbB/YkuD
MHPFSKAKGDARIERTMKKIPYIIGIMFFLLCQPGLRLQAGTVRYNQIQAVHALRRCLENMGGPMVPRSQLMGAVSRFYEDRQFQPAWMRPDGLTSEGADLLAALKSSPAPNPSELNVFIQYLETMLQDTQQLTAVTESLSPDTMLKAEVGITQCALFWVIRNSSNGLVFHEPPGDSQNTMAPPGAANLSDTLAPSVLEALLKAASPRHKSYMALKRALERYETIRMLGGWPTIPEGPRLEPGGRDPRVPLLRQRLVIAGDAGLETFGLNDRYDAALVAGVRRFQHRHGLRTDGVVGATTLAALNTGVEERITQIQLNMQRWCRLPQRLGERYLLANIPGFRLDVVENGQVACSMRTIVGKPERRTPVMSAMMTYMEINPYWNIPQKIASSDILPKIHDDPRFLQQNGIQVFDSWRESASALDPLAIDWSRYSEAYFPFRLRQEPSAVNALGRIKFMFPNRFSVYIHDTPAKALFSKDSRSYSSGCVRIENPVALASHILAAQGWSRYEIETKVKSRKRTVVVLKEPVPVHLVYMTAWAEEDGTVDFYHDPYEYDQGLLEELSRPHATEAAWVDELMTVNRFIEKSLAL